MSEENFNTDSTNNSNKEKEKNIKFENKINNESQNEYNEFKEPDNGFNWIYNVHNTYHFKQDIERVWAIIKHLELLSIINCKGHYPIVHIKGKDTWKPGNIFKGNLSGIYPFVAKVMKCINFPEKKKIDLVFYLKKGYYFNIKIELYKVTEDNSTVLLNQVKFEKLELKEEIQIFLKNNEIKTLEKIENILEKEPINLLKYESGIISGKMEDIWNFVLDFTKIMAIAPNNNFIPNIDIKSLKVGEKREVSVFQNDQIRYYDITLKCREERPGWNKWLIFCEGSGGRPTKISKHSFLLQLTKINNNECQLSLLTKYHEPIDNNEFKELSESKKYLLLSLKDYFENFYTPSSSN
jgi:hypothetical protein